MDPSRLPRRTDYDAAGTWRIIQTRDFVGYVNTRPSPSFFIETFHKLKLQICYAMFIIKQKKMFEYSIVYIICSIQNIPFITKMSALFYKCKVHL